MDIVECVRKKRPESGRLDYKSKQTPKIKIAKNLASFANTNGGTVVVGVPEKDGHPTEPQNIENPHSLIDQIHETISSRVSPVVTPEPNILEIDGKTILGLSLAKSDNLHSIALDMDQPVFPVRHGPQTRYLSGEEVTQRISSTQSNESDDEDETDLLRLPDEIVESNQESHFIEAPDGHISDICVFSNIYYPEHPKRIVLRSQYLSEHTAENIFAHLDRIFNISVGDANYTINESNGAWIGKGYYHFVADLRSQHKRHSQVIQSGYDLKQYGQEQAVLIADLGGVYPESTIILYAAPFDDSDGYRYLTINLLVEGNPVDVRPLIEFQEQTGLKLSTAEDAEIRSDGISNPSRIPVDVIKRTRQISPLGDGEQQSIDGAICRNPFYGEEDYLNRSLDITRPRPISKYQNLYAFLHDWDDPDNPREYETRRFVVSDLSEFTRGIYANVQEVKFDINW